MYAIFDKAALRMSREIEKQAREGRETIKVKNIQGKNGRAIPNQFIITDDKGVVYFQSYKTIIAKNDHGAITLDKDSWDFSRTTGKYRNQFLGETREETESLIKSGKYTLANLN